MIDSYVLYMISNIDYARSLGKLDKEIVAQISMNNVIVGRT